MGNSSHWNIMSISFLMIKITTNYNLNPPFINNTTINRMLFLIALNLSILIKQRWNLSSKLNINMRSRFITNIFRCFILRVSFNIKYISRILSKGWEDLSERDLCIIWIHFFEIGITLGKIITLAFSYK